MTVIKIEFLERDFDKYDFFSFLLDFCAYIVLFCTFLILQDKVAIFLII